MRAAMLLALVLSGCEPLESGLATVACGQHLAATHHVPDSWPCWALSDSGECVVTARPDVDACNVPDDSDELFAGGDEATEWCGVLEERDADRRIVPVDCATGIALGELQYGVRPEEQR